jgi:hypothetical protein
MEIAAGDTKSAAGDIVDNLSQVVQVEHHVQH